MVLEAWHVELEAAFSFGIKSSEQTLCRKRVKCFKQMYKIGKDKNIQPYFLFFKILKPALYLATHGYLLYNAGDLKKEGENLMRDMTKFENVFGKESMVS